MKSFISISFVFLICISCHTINTDDEYSDVFTSEVYKEVKPDIEIKSLPLTKVQNEYISGYNVFTMDLLSEIFSNNNQSSFVYSPLGMQYILGMMANMVDSSVSDKFIQYAYGESVSLEDYNEYLKLLLYKLPALDLNSTISVVNFLLLSNQYEFDNTNIDYISDSYRALVSEVDFNDPLLSFTVNNWAKYHTNGLINNPVSSFDASITVFFMNSLYFSAPWSKNFNKDNTCVMEFKSENLSVSDVQMMSSIYNYPYFENEMMQILELPYGNEKFVMSIFLPKNGYSLSEILSILDLSCLDLLSNEYLSISLPKMNISSKLNMKNILIDLGWDFLNSEIIISAGNKSPISSLFQTSVISIDENGSIASSVTSSESGTCWDDSENEILPIEFIANHPFAFAVYDKTSNVILFSGIYNGN